jgi:hypothetical protein
MMLAPCVRGGCRFRTLSAAVWWRPQPGYGWSFPVGDGVANIGVGFLPSAPRSHGKCSSAGAAEQLVGPLRGYPIRFDFLRAPTYAPPRCWSASGWPGQSLTGEGIDLHWSRSDRRRYLARSAPVEYHVTLHQRWSVFRFSEHVRTGTASRC